MGGRHLRNVRQGFVSLNQPSMISDVIAQPEDDYEEVSAVEIIEESNSRIDPSNEESSELDISKNGQITIR